MKAFIDWLNFSWTDWDSRTIVPFTASLLKDWLQVQIVGESAGGLHGFDKSMRFYVPSNGALVLIAIVAWGGLNQKGRAWFQLDGQGCSLVKDWQLVFAALERLDARITRADVAVDAIEGGFTVEDVSRWYQDGEFNCGGRTPVFNVKGDWFHHQGAGRTAEIGKRQNGKVARIYEKGKQLGAGLDHVLSDWTRFEVEVHNVDREIPHDIVVSPGKYFAGMYPCCERLVDVGSERIATIKAEGELSLSRLIGYTRLAYGRVLTVMSILNDDPAQIIAEVSRPGVPRRLEKSSLHIKPPEGVSLGVSP